MVRPGRISPRQPLFLFLYLGIAACIGLLAAGGYYVLQVWPKQAHKHPATVFEVPQGASLRTVANALQDQSLIENNLFFRMHARASGLDRQLQAGVYELSADLSPAQLLRRLAAGMVQQHAIRLPEGANLRSVMSLLGNNDVLSQESAGLMHLADELQLQLPFAEGAFFPDTYFVSAGASELSVLQRAHDAMITKLMQAWQQRAPNLEVQTPTQALVLASIIEKESDGESDRRQISQVFHLRLQQNMKLQTDPTVIYALGEGFDGDIKRGDLRVDSPFNTYRYRGLPPTPIALPSLASIEAALNPADGDFLYFVARGDGSSQFSRTLGEHNAAVRRYQLSKGDP